MLPFPRTKLSIVMIGDPQVFDHRIQCRVLTGEIQSLVSPGNKAINENKFDNCKEYEHLNKIVADIFLSNL